MSVCTSKIIHYSTANTLFMKHYWFSFFLSVHFFSCAPSSRLNKIDVRTMLKESFLRINDSVWVSRYEATTFEYSRFLVNQNECASTYFLPDCTKIYQRLGTPLCPNFLLPFADWPITLVEHKDAVRFCAYLQARYSKSCSGLSVRLPTHEEWRSAEAKVRQRPDQIVCASYFPQYLPSLRTFLDSLYRNEPPSNDASIQTARFVENFQEKELWPYLSYFRGPLCLKPDFDKTLKPLWCRHDTRREHNFLGNVAEFVAEPGIAVGGSWVDRQEDCTPVSVRQMENSIGYDVGFRICLVVPKRFIKLKSYRFIH